MLVLEEKVVSGLSDPPWPLLIEVWTAVIPISVLCLAWTMWSISFKAKALSAGD